MAAQADGAASTEARNASAATQRMTAWNASTPASRTAPAADGSNGVSPDAAVVGEHGAGERADRGDREDAADPRHGLVEPGGDAREVLRRRVTAPPP